jgi:hypothetical protein
MSRRTLDTAFGIGGLVFSVVLLVLGLVLTNQANFASDYVHDQLSQQQISFTPVEGLSGEQDDAPCLVEFAGELMTTGKQAECYANEYIAYHLAGSAEEAGYPGATYATLGTPQRELRGQLQEATDAGQSTDAIQADLDEVNALRDTMFRGETLRGLLLTTYGFSIFGERAELAALLCYIAAAVLFLLSIAGLVHAHRVPKNQRVGAPAPVEPDAEVPTPVTVG